MNHVLVYGEDEQGLIVDAVRNGDPIPDFIQDAPKLETGLSLYYLAFWDLQGDRGGMGGPILWTSIEMYADRLELEDCQREALHHHIRAMDVAQNSHQSKKGKRNGHGDGISTEDEQAS